MDIFKNSVGRPKKLKKRSKLVAVRLTDEEYEDFLKCIKRNHLKCSEGVRTAIRLLCVTK